MTQPAAGPTQPAWRLGLLGETVTVWGAAAPWHPGPAAALTLAYLALEGATPRDRLAGMLWPERPEMRARANLRQLLLRVRASAPILEGDPLRLAPGVWVDARDLPEDALAGSGSGPLLAGIDATPWPGLADWLVSRQTEHAAHVKHALLDLIASARAVRDLAAASAAAERLAHLDPWSEAACRAVMEVALAQGEPAAALRAFRRLRRALARELGTGPGEQTVALARRAARAAGASRQVRSGLEHVERQSLRIAQRAEAGGWLREGAELLLQTVESLEGGAETGSVLTELAWLEHRLGWNRRAEGHARRALELATGVAAEKVGAEASAADACFVLGSLAWAGGNLEEARDRWHRALRGLHRDDRATRLRLSLDLALVEDALGRADVARRHYLAALELSRVMGERHAEAKVLNNLGAQLVQDGRSSDGLALLRRAHALARALRDRLLEGYVLDSIAAAQLASRLGPGGQTGDLASARTAAARAVAIGMDAGDARLQIEALLTLSRVSRATGDGEGARRYAEGALERAEASGWAPLSASAREHLARVEAEARAGTHGRDAGVTPGGAG